MRWRQLSIGKLLCSCAFVYLCNCAFSVCVYFCVALHAVQVYTLCPQGAQPMVWRRVSIGKLHLQLGLLNNRLLSIDIRNIIVITGIIIVIIFIIIVINNHHQCHYHGHYQLVTSIAQHPATIN